MIFLSKSPEQTEEFAQKFAQQLKTGDCIGLCGELGSGKTRFVQGLYLGLGGDPKILVHSPTFTLLHDYPLGPVCHSEAKPKNPPRNLEHLYHFDLYRLNSYAEFLNLDFEDYLTKNICVIEWADKFSELRALCNWWIEFAWKGEWKRQITVSNTSSGNT